MKKKKITPKQISVFLDLFEKNALLEIIEKARLLGLDVDAEKAKLSNAPKSGPERNKIVDEVYQSLKKIIDEGQGNA